MEKSAEFDLDRQLERWRIAMRESLSLREEEIKELEGHLRDGVEALESKGLSEEEAFLIAVRRFGCSAEISNEFMKTKGGFLETTKAKYLGAAAATLIFLGAEPFGRLLVDSELTHFDSWIGLAGAGVGAVNICVGLGLFLWPRIFWSSALVLLTLHLLPYLLTAFLYRSPEFDALAFWVGSGLHLSLLAGAIYCLVRVRSIRRHAAL